MPFYSETSYKQTYTRHDVRVGLDRLSLRSSLPFNISPKIPSLKDSPAIRHSLSQNKTQITNIVKIFPPIRLIWQTRPKFPSKGAALTQIPSRTTKWSQRSSLSTDTSRNRPNLKEAVAIKTYECDYSDIQAVAKGSLRTWNWILPCPPGQGSY